MNNNFDFGFDSEEFVGQSKTVPYCQFINSSNKTFGLGVTAANAELTEFSFQDNWEVQTVEFADGTEESMILTKSPRLVVLNKSKPLMAKENSSIEIYNRDKIEEGGYKVFSYAVVWFLDNENKPLSASPFRLKLSGYSGITFLKNYEYYNEQNCFTRQFLKTYKEVTGDKSLDKSRLFYAHAVFNFKLDRQKVTSSVNGQSSFAVQTTGFLTPTPDNIKTLIIPNKTETSDRIKELVESTQNWINFGNNNAPKNEPEMSAEEANNLNEQEKEVAENTSELLADAIPF